MTDDVHWVSSRIAEARKPLASVTDATTVRLEQMLNGQLSERQLSSAELTTLAIALLGDMGPPSLNQDEIQ